MIGANRAFRITWICPTRRESVPDEGRNGDFDRSTRSSPRDVPSEGAMLVAPDGVLYHMPDEAALQRVALAREPQLDSSVVANLCGSCSKVQWMPKPTGRKSTARRRITGKCSRAWSGWDKARRFGLRIAIVGIRDHKSTSSSTSRLEQAVVVADTQFFISLPGKTTLNN